MPVPCISLLISLAYIMTNHEVLTALAHRPKLITVSFLSDFYFPYERFHAKIKPYKYSKY